MSKILKGGGGVGGGRGGRGVNEIAGGVGGGGIYAPANAALLSCRQSEPKFGYKVRGEVRTCVCEVLAVFDDEMGCETAGSDGA